jgi:hypothetical protein
MRMTHRPFARAMTAAGQSGFEEAFTYQDYLYELCADGFDAKPVSERQWEAICDMQGSRRLMYASNSKMAVESAERRASA